MRGVDFLAVVHPVRKVGVLDGLVIIEYNVYVGGKRYLRTYTRRSIIVV